MAEVNKGKISQIIGVVVDVKFADKLPDKMIQVGDHMFTKDILGADKIATGHNLDDEIQSFLMSFARGDLIKFSKFGPELDVIHPKLIPRIKPLWNTPEKEVGTWAILNDINIHLDECPYSHLSLRAKIKEFLNNNEDIYPGIKNNIMESFQKILTFESDIPSNLNECRLCGEPTSSDICKACELKKLISENHESHI